MDGTKGRHANVYMHKFQNVLYDVEAYYKCQIPFWDTLFHSNDTCCHIKNIK